jgi:hypothetical protein
MAQITFVKKLTRSWWLLFVLELVLFIDGLGLVIVFFKGTSIAECLSDRIYFPAVSLIDSLIVTIVRLEINKFKGISQ